MDKELQITLTQTVKHLPLAAVSNLPGPDAELTPTQLRGLAAALIAAADDCSRRPMEITEFRAMKAHYSTEMSAATPHCTFTGNPTTPDTCQFSGKQRFSVLSPLEEELQKFTPDQYLERENAIRALFVPVIAELHLLKG